MQPLLQKTIKFSDHVVIDIAPEMGNSFIVDTNAKRPVTVNIYTEREGHDGFKRATMYLDGKHHEDMVLTGPIKQIMVLTENVAEPDEDLCVRIMPFNPRGK